MWFIYTLFTLIEQPSRRMGQKTSAAGSWRGNREKKRRNKLDWTIKNEWVCSKKKSNVLISYMNTSRKAENKSMTGIFILHGMTKIPTCQFEILEIGLSCCHQFTMLFVQTPPHGAFPHFIPVFVFLHTTKIKLSVIKALHVSSYVTVTSHHIFEGLPVVIALGCWILYPLVN